jgi:hypothetical protein
MELPYITCHPNPKASGIEACDKGNIKARPAADAGLA